MVRINVYKILAYMLIISSLALFDIKPIFIGSQIMMFIYIFLLICKNRKIVFGEAGSFFIKWLLLFIIFSFLSILWANSDNNTVISSTLSIVQVGFITICLIQYAYTSKNIEIIYNAWILSGIVLSIRFFLMIPMTSWGQMSRFSKMTLFGYNTPALVLSYGIVLILYKMLVEKRYLVFICKIKMIVICCLFLFVSLMCGTRKGLIIVAVGLLLISIFNSKNPLSLIGKIGISVVVIIAMFFIIMKNPILYGAIGYRIESLLSGIAGGISDKSFMSRMQFIIDAWKVFENNPIIGIGQDGYRYINSIEMNMYSHNNYTELLANLGLVGTGIYYSLYIKIFIKALKLIYITYLPLILIIILFIIDYSSVNYSSEINYIIFALIILYEDIVFKGRLINRRCSN